MNDFEPKIIAFCCEYCGYAAADLAGSLRLAYPPNMKIIKVPCTGRVDILTIVKAIENGVDGVFVFGCLEGNCHFEAGNLRAKKRTIFVRELLAECGIEEDRVAMFHTSASMGVQFARHANEATERIRALGPNPVRKMPAAALRGCEGNCRNCGETRASGGNEDKGPCMRSLQR